MSVAKKLAAEFFDLGGRLAFGIPGGGSSLDWVDAFTGRGGTFVTTGHEATGAFMAGACGRFSQPAAAVSIKGPGVANLFPALAANRYEGYPMLAFSEAYAALSVRRHKWMDHGELFRPILRRPGPSESLVRGAWQAACREIPGPVFLEIREGNESRAGREAPILRRGVLDALERSERPLLLLGGMARRQNITGALATLGMPVFTTAAAKGLLDETLPQAAGIMTGDGSAETVERRLLASADCVIGLGVNGGELLNPALDHQRPAHWFLPGETESFPPDALDQTLCPDSAAFWGLLASKSWGLDILDKARKNQAAQAAEWAEFFSEAALPDVCHVLDTGNFTVLAEHFLPARHADQLFGTPNGRFMGAGIGYALGAAFARRSCPVILWIGDGGIRSYFSELALAVEHRLPLLAVCIRDGHYGSILGRARSAGLNPAPLAMNERHLLEAAEAMGFATGRTDSLSSAIGMLKSWHAAPAPFFLECSVEAGRYIAAASALR